MSLAQGIYLLLSEIILWVGRAIILAAIFSMLASFGVLDTRNRIVWSIGDFLYRITDPLLRPVRNRMPSLGTIDISPMIVLLLLWYVAQPLLRMVFIGVTTGIWSFIV